MARRTREQHGLRGDSTYQCWNQMIQRCTNRNSPAFERYGELGVHGAWKDSFLAFVSDVGLRPSLSHSIERLDNERGYYPGNVAWADKKEQARNRRSTKWVVVNGQRVTMCEAAKLTGIDRHTVSRRLNRGWSLQDAATTPRRRKPAAGFTVKERVTE